jgi:hypothetical protein
VYVCIFNGSAKFNCSCASFTWSEKITTALVAFRMRKSVGISLFFVFYHKIVLRESLSLFTALPCLLLGSHGFCCL